MKNFMSGCALLLSLLALPASAVVTVVECVDAEGNSSFRDKCLRRIERLSGQGRTLVVVSHDLPLMERLCDRGVVLDAGRLVADGPVTEAVAHLRVAL